MKCPFGLNRSAFIVVLSLSLLLWVQDSFAAALCVDARGNINTRSKCRKGEGRMSLQTIAAFATSSAGPRGEKGEKGDVGPKGERGEKGEKGDPGQISQQVVAGPAMTQIPAAGASVGQISAAIQCPIGHVLIASACVGGEQVPGLNISGFVDSTGTILTCRWANSSTSVVPGQFFPKGLCSPF